MLKRATLNENGYSSGKSLFGFGGQTHRKKVSCSYLQGETKRNFSINDIDGIPEVKFMNYFLKFFFQRCQHTTKSSEGVRYLG